MEEEYVSQTGSFIHGIFQARVLEWGAIAFSEQKGLRSLFYSFLSPSARGCVGLSGSGTERREEIADGAGSHASQPNSSREAVPYPGVPLGLSMNLARGSTPNSWSQHTRASALPAGLTVGLPLRVDSHTQICDWRVSHEQQVMTLMTW